MYEQQLERCKETYEGARDEAETAKTATDHEQVVRNAGELIEAATWLLESAEAAEKEAAEREETNDA